MKNDLIKPWNRKLIIILDQFHKDELELSDDGKELLRNNEILVVNIEEYIKIQDKICILGNAKPSPNTVLTMSPFADNTYFDIVESTELVPLYKANSFIKLCHLLGAKSVQFVSIKFIETDSKKESNVSLESLQLKTEVNINNNTLFNLKNKLSIKSEFEGAEPQIEKATLFLKERGLTSDSTLSNLIDLRKDDIVNKAKYLEYELSLTESLTKSFNLAASVKYITMGLKGNYSSITKKTIDMYLKTVVTF